MTTGTLALIILAVILAQVAIVVLLGLYRRRRQLMWSTFLLQPS